MSPLPWDALADALEREREAQRTGDALAECEAIEDVGDARLQVGLLGYSLFSHMVDLTGPDAIPVGFQTHYLGPIQQDVWTLAELCERLKSENWTLANAVADLERRVVALEARLAHERS
jgi:hypothetical protein